MIGSDTVGRRRWSRSVRFQGRRADSGEMAARGACDREIRPSRLMFFLSPIVEVQPGNVNVANFYSSEAQHRPGELPTPESGTGGRYIWHVAGPGDIPWGSDQLEERR